MRLAIYAMRIFTPTLTLPRQGGGDYKVVGQPLDSPLGTGDVFDIIPYSTPL